MTAEERCSWPTGDCACAAAARPAASIGEDKEFQRLTLAVECAAIDSHACGGDNGTGKVSAAAWDALVAYLDARGRA